MNLGWFGVPPSGGSNGLDRMKPGLQAVRGCMVLMHGMKVVGAFHEPLEAPLGFGVRQSSGALAMEPSQP